MAIKTQPVNKIEWVKRDTLHANGYNPNHVPPIELDLLALSILEDGWTQPIVARADGEIVDGFHRWTVSARPEIAALTGGLVPVARLTPRDMPSQIMATIRHNRARGNHGIPSMAAIIQDLKDNHGLSDKQIQDRLGMEDEEVERLYDKRGKPERTGANRDFNNGWEPQKK